MIGLEWLAASTFGVTTVAFLAPMPPDGPKRQAPEPLRGDGQAAPAHRDGSGPYRCNRGGAASTP